MPRCKNPLTMLEFAASTSLYDDALFLANKSTTEQNIASIIPPTHPCHPRYPRFGFISTGY